MTQPVYRFAPSPNGLLHLGHAYSALLNYERARREGGRFLLRIEDIDPTRSLTHYEDAIYEDLEWLGIEWEKPVLRQSDHLSFYAEAISTLDQRGLLYPCFCTRAEIAAASKGIKDPDGAPLYPGTCRVLSQDEREQRVASGRPHVMRLRCAALTSAFLSDLWFDEYGEGEEAVRTKSAIERWGDVMLARKDVRTSYHLSVVLDDARQGVTDVIRGMDLRASTDIHRVLQAVFDLSPPRYRHHRLITDDEGEKLSKSRESRSLRDLRDEGVTRADIRHVFGFDRKD